MPASPRSVKFSGADVSAGILARLHAGLKELGAPPRPGSEATREAYEAAGAVALSVSLLAALPGQEWARAAEVADAAAQIRAARTASHRAGQDARLRAGAAAILKAAPPEPG